MLELAFRQSMGMGIGPVIFLRRPITLAFLIMAAIVLVISLKFLKRLPDELKEDSE